MRRASYENFGRKPRSVDVSNDSPYVKSRLKRLETSNSESETLRKQKEYARGAVERRTAERQRDQVERGGSGETLRLPGLQPGAPVSGAESAERVDGDQRKGKGKKRGSVSSNTGSQRGKRGDGSDDLLS